MSRAARRAGTILRGLAALLTLAALIIGMPAVLYRFGGSPVPAHLPALHQVTTALTHRDTGSLFLAAAADVAWLAWAAFTLAVLAEAQAALRGRQAPRLAGLGALQGTAGRLVAAAALTFSVPAAALFATAAPPAAAAVISPAAPAAHATAAATARTTAPEAARVTTTAAYQLVTVRPGQCLWTIAEQHLGAGDRYPEIVALNLGRAMGDGQTFTRPDLIDAGWQLRIPSAAGHVQPPAAARHARHRAQHDGHPTRRPPFSRQHRTAAPPSAVPAPAAAGAPEVVLPAAVPAADGTTTAAAPAVHQELPGLGIFAAGMLAGGAVTTLARMRRRQRQQRRPGRRIPLPASPAARRAEQRLNAASAPVPLTDLRAALSVLAAGIAASGQPLPGIAGIHLSPDVLEVLLTTPPAAPAPPPYLVAPGRQGMVWQLPLPAAALPGAGRAGDLMPGLFTAGLTDAGGHLLLDAEAMQVTSCTGPADLIDQVLATIAAELATSQWSGWYDLILAGCPELDVIGRAENCADLDEALSLLAVRADALARRMPAAAPGIRQLRLTQPDDEDWTLCLLVSRLPPSPDQMERLIDLTGNGCVAAIVAGDSTGIAPANLDLTPDPSPAGGILARLTPLQITVRPQALTSGDYQSLASLFAAAGTAGDVSAAEPPYDAFAGPAWIPAPAAADTVALEPGAAEDPLPPPDDGEIRAGQPDPLSPEPPPGGDVGSPLRVSVLGPFEIAGSAASLQPKQHELVLALALSGPSGSSNSALCTLLGTDPDHPKPSDSLRQIITRTRRRLGPAPDGREYIEHVGNGRYVLHASATLDWSVFHALAEQGRQSETPAPLREAVTLIRGKPFDGIFHWWLEVPLLETVRAEVVDTTELLARLELAAGDPAAAGRAARAGLSVDVAAEQLWRALMRAEAAAGNLSGVHLAWKHCLDAISDIDPAGEPDPDTEALYRQLTHSAREPAGAR